MAKRGQQKDMKEILVGPGGGQYKGLSLAKDVFVEYFCTALFVYVATSTVTSGCHTKDVAAASGNNASLTKVEPGSCFLGSTNLVNIALAFGGAIGILVYCAASFSGGHLNPAVTVAFLVTARVSVVRALLYIIFQCLGACTGSALVLAIDSGGYTAALGAANRLNQGVSLASAWGFETILTCLLVFTVFAATDAQRAVKTAHLPVLAPFAIGGAVFLSHLVAVPLDGCSINPARSFGPAAVAHEWKNHWVFWVGPIGGGLLAAAIYTMCTWQHGGPQVGHSTSPQRGPPAHLPSFSGAHGLPLPQSRPSSAPTTSSIPESGPHNV